MSVISEAWNEFSLECTSFNFGMYFLNPRCNDNAVGKTEVK